MKKNNNNKINMKITVLKKFLIKMKKITIVIVIVKKN